MDVVNQRMELPQEKKLAQVEELVKHQISRVEKILESSLTRTAALIEKQKKRAKEDEDKRKNIEKNRIILNTIDTSRDNKLIKTKHDGDFFKNQNVQEKKLNDALISKVSNDFQGKVPSNSVHTQMSSKTYKSVGTNTDAKIKLQSQISEDKPAQLTPEQQLVIFDSIADRKRQQFAGRKVYKHKVRKVTGPICTISISIDQPPERISSNTEESPECKRIVVGTPNRGSIGRDVFDFSDAVQKNNLQFCNRGSQLSDIAQTFTSNEQSVDNKGKLTLDLDVSEIHKNCQIKEYVPQTVSSLKESSINNKSAKSRIKGVDVESDFSEISNITPERTTSKAEEIRLPHHISVSSDSSSGTILIENVKVKRHKRKANKTKHTESSESETFVSSRHNEELSRKDTKDTPERNDMKSFRITKIHTWKKTFDLDKKADGDNFKSSRHSKPELRNIRKAECERHNEMKCVSEGNIRSYPSTTGRSQSGQNVDQSIRRITSSYHLFTDSCDQTGMKSFSNHQPNSPHETASISSDNTICGLSRNLSKASVEYQQLENKHFVSSKALKNDEVEPYDIISDIACDRLVGHEKAMKYSLPNSADCIPATPDGTHSNQNTEHHDAGEYVTLLQEVEDAGIREVICNKLERETNLKLKEDESDQNDTCQFEKLKSYNGEPETESIQNDMTINNREQSPSATDSGGDNVLDFVTSLQDIQNPCDKTFPSAQTLFDESSSTARSFKDKYHLVMDTLEKHLIVSQASEDSNDTPSDEIRLHKKGGRRRSKSVSLENSVSSGKSLKNGPLSDPVISKPKRKQRVQLSSEFHSQVHTSECAVQERLFGDSDNTIQLSSTKDNSKCVDVISYFMSESSVRVDDSVIATSGYLDSLIHNHSIQAERESTLNDIDLSLNLTPKLENNQTQTEPIDLSIDDNSASVPTLDVYNDVLTSSTSFRFEIEESLVSVPCPKQNQVVNERCINIDNYVGESCSPNELDSTDNERLDSSFYERSVSRRNTIRTENESSSSDVSFVAESSVSSLKVFVPANDKGRSQHDNASDSSVSVPLSLAYYSDLVTPVTSLKYVIDEWSEPLGKPFKIKQKPKRFNRKKIITDVHVKISGDNRKQLQSLRRISTPCHVSKSVSATSSIHESDLVQGESELSTSVIQYPSIHALSNTDDNEVNIPESNLDRTTVSHFKDDYDDSILSSNSSVVAYERRPNVTRVTNDPVFRSTNSYICGGLEDEATTTDDVESSILPEDVDDTTDIDEQLQMEETDFSEVTDVLGTSTETFTKIENPNFTPNVNK